MDFCIFYAGFAGLYLTMAIEYWHLRHRRLACCYGLAAGLALGFAAIHLPFVPTRGGAAWV